MPRAEVFFCCMFVVFFFLGGGGGGGICRGLICSAHKHHYHVDKHGVEMLTVYHHHPSWVAVKL